MGDPSFSNAYNSTLVSTKRDRSAIIEVVAVSPASTSAIHIRHHFE